MNSGIISAKLDATVGILSESIACEWGARPCIEWSEPMLRRELVACVLGSQVRYEVAVTFTNNLEREGLLSDTAWKYGGLEDFRRAVLKVLIGGHQDRSYSYRFPHMRAEQLARLRVVLMEAPLEQRLKKRPDARKLRSELVADLAGIGPKQASMFLRNVGASRDLAVLDTHVIRFMHTIGLLSSSKFDVSGLSGYERIEYLLIDYAQRLGFAVGIVDMAIWATMKAARELCA